VSETPFDAHYFFQGAWLRLERFTLVGDDGSFRENAGMEEAEALDYGCGLFEFVNFTVL
jgi:hypothetical protein